MTGADEVYDHTPYYYSKVFGISYEAVGTLDASLETVVDEKGDGEAVAYYLGDDGAVEGVLLWNVEEARDAARAVIAAGVTPRDALVGRI